jgi:hypothetical protein
MPHGYLEWLSLKVHHIRKPSPSARASNRGE